MAGLSNAAVLSCANSKTSFKFEENPKWRKSEITTSQMVEEITEWRKMPIDNERFMKNFVAGMSVEYLLNLNQDELIGTQTRENTEEVIKKILCQKPKQTPEAEKEEKETINTYTAMDTIYKFHEEMDHTGMLTVDQINGIHKILLKGLHRNCGTIRETEAVTRLDVGFHYYPSPEKVKGLLYALVDHHNISMENLPEDKSSLEYTTQVFKCAARLLFDFVDTHPYGNGNGRMCRLLANHITGLITPFPVSLYHKSGSRSERSDYINAIVRCRENPEEGPRELAAMLVEGAWHGWKKLLADIKKQIPLSVVIKKSCLDDKDVSNKVLHIWKEIEFNYTDVKMEEVVSKILEEANKADTSTLQKHQYLSVPIAIEDHIAFYLNLYNI